ncbi:MAG TPA: hypothetical protein VFW48_07000 [Solirubrobacterales bacterium]|nr:hypothetical protein [Solirubrobacterales bacterium]
MNKTAAFHEPDIFRSRSFWIALFASLSLLFAGFCESAAAKRHPLVGGDGKIHACYRVKGKPRGALRVVRSHKVRCRRGERKVAWAAAAVSGASGAQGAQGGSGQTGTQVSADTSLLEQVGLLTSRVDKLEGTLGGISKSDLTGMMDTLDGVTNADLAGALETVEGLTNEDLTDAVDSLPAIESLCEQSEDLTEQVNLLQDVVGGLGLSPGLDALGLLEIPTLPEPLEPFSCPAP